MKPDALTVREHARRGACLGSSVSHRTSDHQPLDSLVVRSTVRSADSRVTNDVSESERMGYVRTWLASFILVDATDDRRGEWLRARAHEGDS